jgi:hypothetical protein
MINVLHTHNTGSTEDEAAQKLAERRERYAGRIASRALSSFNNGQLSLIVRGGPLGFYNTFHETEVYDLVAQRLLEEAEIETTVHAITARMAVNGITYSDTAAHIISAATVKGWPRYNPKHPLKNATALAPTAYRVEKVEQVYPPLPPEVPVS